MLKGVKINFPPNKIYQLAKAASAGTEMPSEFDVDINDQCILGYDLFEILQQVVPP